MKESKKTIEINETKSWLFEKISKMDKSSVRFTEKKAEDLRK